MAKEKYAVKKTGTVSQETTAAEKIYTVLKHEEIKLIAESFEYNRLSPLSALHLSKKKGAEIKNPFATDVLEAILKPQKICDLTTLKQRQMVQKILLVKDSSFYRWIDEDGKVVISTEKNPRHFLDSIVGEIAATVSQSDRSVTLLKKEQIKILKGIYYLCQALIFLKVAVVFTTLGHLKSFLKAGDEMKGHVEELAQKGLIKCTGINDPIITLERMGEEIINVLENYDTFYHLQVMSEKSDEYPSLYLIARAGKLFMLSNPMDSDDVIIRTIDAAELRSILGWAWVTDLLSENKYDNAPAS